MHPCSEFEVILIRFPSDIFLSKNTEKTYKNEKKKYISTCNHLHVDRYDTMNHCRTFEEILMRT